MVLAENKRQDLEILKRELEKKIAQLYEEIDRYEDRLNYVNGKLDK